MNERPVTVYIHDLDISNKSKCFLLRAGILKLNDLLNCDITEFSDKRGMSDDVLSELNSVIAHANDILGFFEKRKKRIIEILPYVQDYPIEKLGLGAHSIRALKRGDINTVGELIQMSRKDILELRNVGESSFDEITAAIESVVRCGKIEYHEPDDTTEIKVESVSDNDMPENNILEDDRIIDILPEMQSIGLDDVPLSTRAKNALKREEVWTVGDLVQLSETDIMRIRNVGTQTRDEIIDLIDSIIREGKAYFDNLKATATQDDETSSVGITEGKGFDFQVIDELIGRFGFKPTKMTEWFGLSRQGIYNALEKRSPKRSSVWTGKNLSEEELVILNALIERKLFDYNDDTVSCCCMNNRQDDFVCIFIYENEIKCFHLKDLPDEIQERIIDSKMQVYTQGELMGESDGRLVYFLKKPYFQPDNPERFRANAQMRGMSTEDYALFISGYHYLSSNSTTDEKIIAFLQNNMINGKVYISSDNKNQWIRSIASRNGYSLRDLILLYGFEILPNDQIRNTDGTRKRHREILQRYIVHDNVVFLPTNSSDYRIISTYAYKQGIDIAGYLRSLGFERTTVRPDSTMDVLEKDMEVRQIEGKFEDKLFAAYPLIGSRILKPETLDTLNSNARNYIDRVLREPSTKLSLRTEMQLTLALINYAKNWHIEENSNFWNYITLQFGYRDENGTVRRLLQSSLENAMKRNRRLFLENANGREFKATILIHALSTKRSWMALFDFLFDFYKSNLNWRVIPDDPLIPMMIRALQQKMSGSNEEDVELTISSKAYYFQEGIRKLILYRPIYTKKLFESLIRKIDALVNSEIRPIKTYEEQLCEEWFKDKINAIANTKKKERQRQDIQHDIALDYSRIRAKYILKDETDVQIVIPDIRLKNDNIRTAVLSVRCDGSTILQQSLSWYGNELGKTLNGVSVSLSVAPHEKCLLNLHVQIKCDDDVIYDSEENLFRKVIFFYGGTEISTSQIRREHYTLVVPSSAELKTENVDFTEIDSMKNQGLKAYFLELREGYAVTVNDQLIAFESENGTGIRIIPPSESISLPSVTFQDAEAVFAYKKSTCSIILENAECTQQFVFLKNGEKIGFESLRRTDNELVFIFPFDGECDTVRLQIINLANERPMFDKTFVLISQADCRFNREFYYSSDDYNGAEYHVDIDGFHEVIPFGKEDDEVRIPYRDGVLHMDIPKILVEETSGAWLHESQSAWYVGAIPQNSFLKLSTPSKVNVQFLVGGKDILYDGQGLVTIGNVLQSFVGDNSFNNADVTMKVTGQKQSESYSLAKVYFKERFLMTPAFWTEENRLFWNQGGGFIGKQGRSFTLSLSGDDDKLYEFTLSEETESILLPEDIPLGQYQYEISIQSGGLFKKTKEIVATGDCFIGDENILRFMNRRIVIESITDENKEEAGHIPIRPCYIDQIQFCGMENTSEGYCPVYNGILYSIGHHGERYEFSFDVHTNKKGITKMRANPVRIVYISDSSLCITDPDRDGLYYNSYFDRTTQSVVYALTDYEYNNANKHKYSNADIYLYRTERI